MSKIRVGVLRGGPSSKYEESIDTGSNILRNLSNDIYIPSDIFISRSGVWHTRGFEVSPYKALKNVDVVFNALHGEYGEDGKVQKELDAFQVPYTGSRAMSSAIAMNKAQAKKIVAGAGIKTPLHVVVEQTSDVEDVATKIFRTFPQPVIIKPLNGGSSVGVLFAGSYRELVDSLNFAFRRYPVVLIEEFIKGKEVTSGVVDNFRGEDKYTLLPIEINLSNGRIFFDYESKCLLDSNHVGINCPGCLSVEEKSKIKEVTQKVHEVLGLRHYSRSDFIVTPQGVYFLEANTLPSLSEKSLVSYALEEAGCSFKEFVDHIIGLAVNGK